MFAIYLYIRRLFGLYKTIPCEGIFVTEDELREVYEKLQIRSGQLVVGVWELVDEDFLIESNKQYREIGRVYLCNFVSIFQIKEEMTKFETKGQFKIERASIYSPISYSRRWIRLEVY